MTSNTSLPNTAENPPLPNTPDGSGPPGSAATGSAPTYTVGYGKPPVHSRVKLGQVLNPKGRPKGQANVRTVLTKTLNERIKLREGDRTRSVSKLDAIILKLVNDAGCGNPKAQEKLFKLMAQVGLVAPHEEPKQDGSARVGEQTEREDLNAQGFSDEYLERLPTAAKEQLLRISKEVRAEKEASKKLH
jgi:Family of unknown function (DUF5681)